MQRELLHPAAAGVSVGIIQALVFFSVLGGSRKLDFAVEFDTHFDVGTS